MKLNIAATKTNLLKIRKSLALTKEGYELLDQKRKILINELNSVMDIAEKLEADLNIMLKDAYATVDKAIVIMGRSRAQSLSFSIDIKNDISISNRRIMGVDVPMIKLKLNDNPPHHSPRGVSFYIDEAIVKFKNVLKLVASLAQNKIALLRIAREVFKTIRKVNALEKIYIPDYEETTKFISDRLDEENRESFCALKMIKTRLKNQRA
ncbi:MAG: V-type ATP synthase subunit D [Candidatus Omnitrophota bacterium]|nr:V-type ATP synthase subunit D [Candidatus Omnitrophota bacterium]